MLRLFIENLINRWREWRSKPEYQYVDKVIDRLREFGE